MTLNYIFYDNYDIIGKRFGSLTVIKKTNKVRYKWSAYLCKCDCGNEVLLSYYELSKKRKYCGNNCKLNSLVGRTIGGLEVLKASSAKPINGRKLYICKCTICGKIIETNRINKRRKSCGCLSTKYNNYIGQKFGMLTVKEETNKKDRNGKPIFICECNCGNTIEIGLSNIYKAKSCGCINNNQEKTNLANISNNKATKRSKSGIKGVYQDKKGNWQAMFGGLGQKLFFNSKGSNEEAKLRCIAWRKEQESIYYKPILEKYNYEKVEDATNYSRI